MKTVCKFKCISVTQNEGDTKSTTMVPVYSNQPDSENAKFWKMTPSGKLELNFTNPEVSFVPGKEYMIEITEA